MSRVDPAPTRYRCGSCMRAVGLSRGNVLLPHRPQRAEQAGADGNCLGTRTAPLGPAITEAGPS